jgi:hypothetical protein
MFISTQISPLSLGATLYTDRLAVPINGFPSLPVSVIDATTLELAVIAGTDT